MLGTLGSFCAEACEDLDFLLRFSPEDFADWVEAGTDWPAGRSLGPLSELEGFDEEHLRWCLMGREARV